MSFFRSTEPLGLPRGSVRALLALGVVGSAIGGVFVLDSDAAGLLLGLAGVVVTSYFRGREDDHGE